MSWGAYMADDPASKDHMLGSSPREITATRRRRSKKPSRSIYRYTRFITNGRNLRSFPASWRGWNRLDSLMIRRSYGWQMSAVSGRNGGRESLNKLQTIISHGVVTAENLPV